jgi:hypothetical protein
MRKVLLAMGAAVSIAFVAAPFATATPIGGIAPCVTAIQIDTAGPYHHARVLEPDSRGNIVGI